MSDDVIPTASLAEPPPDRPGSCPDPYRVSADIAALSNLTAVGVEIDGQVQVGEWTWVIYGHTTYDGEVIVGEYHDAVEAAEVFRAVPGGRPDAGGPVR